MGKKMITLRSGKVEHEFAPESVPVWLDHGWTLVDDGSEEVKTVKHEIEAANKQQKKES